MKATRHGSATITYPSDNEFLITRAFAAPAERVFDAFTTPELVRRWWGYESATWVACQIDLRVGGRWRFVVRDEAGGEVGFWGEYREIERPHRLVNTEVFEGAPDPGPEEHSVVTMTLEEVDGVTTLRLLCWYPSKDVRDMVIATGMESGMQVSYNRLEDLLTRRRSARGGPRASR